MNYAKQIKVKATPQSEPILGSNQIPNNAGGFALPITDRVFLERFLTLGTEGGTYYVSEKKLTVDSAKRIIDMVKKNGTEIVETTVAFSKANRAPKQDPSLFVIALAATFGDARTKQAAYAAISTIARTSTHLFTFCQNIQDLRGWSRGLRRGVSAFYDTKTDEQVAYQMVKYRQRNGWTHRDVLRLAHTKPRSLTRNKLYQYATSEADPGHAIFPVIVGYELAKVCPEPENVAGIIERYNLTWEMVPTEMLNKPEVLEALLYKMPLTAMMRNLNRFATSKLTDHRTSNATKHIVSSFTNEQKLRESRIHPVALLNTHKVYSSGHGVKSGATWSPNPVITDALQDAFEKSFDFVEPTGKKLMLAVDVSGSMQHPISNLAIDCREAAAAITTSFLRTEPNCEVIYFDDKAHKVIITRRTNFNDVLKSMPHGGGTDCSIPYRYALLEKLNLDAFITLTDSETWLGDQHPVQAYAMYKTKVNPGVKGIVVGMVANGVSLFPEEDPLALNVAGFDAAVPGLVNNFLKE